MQLARLIALTLALSVAGAASVEAQGGPPRGGGRMNQAAMLLENITLTADQQPTVDSLTVKFNRERTAAMDKMRADSGDMQAARVEMQKMSEKFRTELRALLTAEQQVVFDRNAEAMAQRQGSRRPPPRGGR